MRVIFMYWPEEPRNGATLPGTLPKPLEAYRGSKSLFLTQRSSQSTPGKTDENVRTIELKNEDVELPHNDDTLYWCKVFKMNDFEQKHHIIRVSFWPNLHRKGIPSFHFMAQRPTECNSNKNSQPFPPTFGLISWAKCVCLCTVESLFCIGENRLYFVRHKKEIYVINSAK
jgi:hypothetical protein